MEIPASGDQIMELTGDKLKELTNAIEDEEDDDEVKYQWLMNLFDWLLLKTFILNRDIIVPPLYCCVFGNEVHPFLRWHNNAILCAFKNLLSISSKIYFILTEKLVFTTIWIAKKYNIIFQLKFTSFPIKIRDAHIWSLTFFLLLYSCILTILRVQVGK